VPAAQDPDLVTLTTKATDDNRIHVAVEKCDLSSVTFYTHNFCDKTTWYENATRVVDEVATDSGDHITYNLVQNNVIDVYHGKITDEDDLLDPSDNSYRVEVKVDDVVKTERDPHENHMGNTSHGDYTVDYANGDIVFHSALTGTEVVKVTYHYATTSGFTVAPKAGKKLQIELVEVQFSNDIEIRDTALFTTYGYVEVFAPSLTPVPYPAGTQIPIRTKRYKTMQNYQDDAMRAYPQVSALGGANWRGLGQPVQIFDWDYQRGLVLHEPQGMKIVISMEHDEPCGGTYCTVTFYCATEDCGT
jgi:hypothetical protein